MLSHTDIYLEVLRRLAIAAGDGQNALDASVRYALLAEAKRIRPVLAMLSTQLFAPKLDDYHWEAATAIEMFHNFTLTHDDIMDNAPLRRGQPTVAGRYGNNSAILAGDVLLIKTYEHLYRTPNYGQVQRIFTETAIDVCYGQQLDMDFESLAEISVEQYLDMIRRKTAVLVGASCGIGAAVGNVAEQTTAQMYGMGCALGLAFQLQDDYLDTYGEAESLGKTIGGDIIQRKKTCLFAYTCSALLPDRKQLFLDVFNNTSLGDRKKIEQVMAFYKEADASKHTLDAVNMYFKESMSILQEIEADSEAKQELGTFAQQLVGRKK